MQIYEKQSDFYRYFVFKVRKLRAKTENFFIWRTWKIEYPVGFGNGHRFGKRGRNGARPIVARFIYRREFEDVLINAFKLRGKPVSIHEQFPAEIENRRKQLYPVMKQAKRMAKWLPWPETNYLLMANGTCQHTKWKTTLLKLKIEQENIVSRTGTILAIEMQ